MFNHDRLEYEDFEDYTLEESLEILREESKKRGIKADDLIVDIEDELKNQDESVAKCNELIQEIVDRLNQNNHDMVCPMCGEGYMVHEEYKGTHTTEEIKNKVEVNWLETKLWLEK